MGGCRFCNNEGFAPDYCRTYQSIEQQLEVGKQFFASKHRGKVKYVAYFQSYSSTYTSFEFFKRTIEQALAVSDIVGCVIGTRPDCISTAQLDYLQSLIGSYDITIEYGIESVYDDVLESVNRCHDFACSRTAIKETALRGIKVGGHIILGLPGTSRERDLQQADILNTLPIDNLKLHQLQILRATSYALEYKKHPEHFHLFDCDEYIRFAAEFRRRLKKSITIERYVSEVPAAYLIAPKWGVKPSVINSQINKLLMEE